MPPELAVTQHRHADLPSIRESIEMAVEYVVPLLDDKLGVIRNLDNPGLLKLQQAAMSFHDNMDNSFSIVYRGVLVFYHLNSYFGRVNHSKDDQMAAKKLLEKLRIEVRRYFQKFTNDQNRMAVLFREENNFRSKHGQLAAEEGTAQQHIGIRMVEWVKADVDFKYSKDTPAIYPQLKERIRDHSTIIASCEAISAWWQDYLGFCDDLSPTTSPEDTTPEDTTFLPSPERQLSLGMLGDHLFPYVHQIVPTITSTAARLPSHYPTCRSLIQAARLDLWRSDAMPISCLPPARWDLFQLQMNSLTMICRPIVLDIEGETFIHHLEARITDIEHYKNHDYGLRVRILPRVLPCPPATSATNPESTKKRSHKFRNRTYRCAFLRINLSFDQTPRKPSITGFAPTSSTSNSTDQKITNKDCGKLVPAAKGFRLGGLGTESTVESTHSFYAQAEGVCIGSFCEWTVIENQALKTTIGESHLGVTLALGALDPAAETSVHATIIATYEYTWEEKQRSMLVLEKWVSKKKTEVKIVEGETSLPFPLLTRLGLVTETDNSKSLLESCALIPPRKL